MDAPMTGFAEEALEAADGSKQNKPLPPKWTVARRSTLQARKDPKNPRLQTRSRSARELIQEASITASKTGQFPSWATQDALKFLSKLSVQRGHSSDSLLESEESDDILSDQEVKLIYEAKCHDANQIEEHYLAFLSQVQRRGKSGHLVLDDSLIGERCAQVLFKCLRGNSHLTKLSLSKNSLGDQGAIFLSSILGDCVCLLNLDLSGNNIGPIGMEALAQGLEKSHVLSLDISSCYIQKNTMGTKGAQAFAELLASKRCRLQDFKLMSVMPCNFLTFAKGLRQNTSLTALDMRANRLDEHAYRKMFEAVQTLNLKRLNLSYNVAYPSTVPVCCAAVPALTSLRTLSLAGLFTSDPHIVERTSRKDTTTFCTALRQTLEQVDCVIQTLVLDGNEFSDKALAQLGEALQVNCSVVIMSLQECGISAKNIQPLTKGLSRNATLMSLHLGSNHLEDAGTVLLVRGLSHAQGSDSGLMFLNLTNNFIGDEGAQALADLIQHNDALQELVVQQNSIHDDGARALYTALGNNETILNVVHRLNAFSFDLAEKIDRLLERNVTSLRTDELKEYRGKVASLSQDEMTLHRVEKELDEASQVLQETYQEHSEIEQTIEQWKVQEAEVTVAMQRQLIQNQLDNDRELERLRMAERNTKTDIEAARYRYLERNDQLTFRISNQKRKKYKLMEEAKKARLAIKKAEEDMKIHVDTEMQLERALAGERRMRTDLSDYIKNTQEKTAETRSRIVQEYVQGMEEYIAAVAAGLKAHDQQEYHQRLHQGAQDTAALFKLQDELKQEMQLRQAKREHHIRQHLDTNSFIAWFFDGKNQGVIDDVVAGYVNEEQARRAAAKVSPLKQIGFREIIGVRSHVVHRRKDLEHCTLIQKSHTIQSLGMHGLRNHTTILVSLYNPHLAREFAQSAEYLRQYPELRRKIMKVRAKQSQRQQRRLEREFNQASRLAMLASDSDSDYDADQINLKSAREAQNKHRRIASTEVLDLVSLWNNDMKQGRAPTPDQAKASGPLHLSRDDIHARRLALEHILQYPDEVRVSVTGGMTVPRVIAVIAESLGVLPQEIKALHYDPAEEAPASPKRHSRKPSTVKPSALETMKEESATFSSFASTAKGALDSFQRKLRDFESRYAGTPTAAQENLEQGDVPEADTQPAATPQPRNVAGLSVVLTRSQVAEEEEEVSVPSPAAQEPTVRRTGPPRLARQRSARRSVRKHLGPTIPNSKWEPAVRQAEDFLQREEYRSPRDGWTTEQEQPTTHMRQRQAHPHPEAAQPSPPPTSNRSSTRLPVSIEENMVVEEVCDSPDLDGTDDAQEEEGHEEEEDGDTHSALNVPHTIGRVSVRRGEPQTPVRFEAQPRAQSPKANPVYKHLSAPPVMRRQTMPTPQSLLRQQQNVWQEWESSHQSSTGGVENRRQRPILRQRSAAREESAVVHQGTRVQGGTLHSLRHSKSVPIPMTILKPSVFQFSPPGEQVPVHSHRPTTKFVLHRDDRCERDQFLLRRRSSRRTRTKSPPLRSPASAIFLQAQAGGSVPNSYSSPSSIALPPARKEPVHVFSHRGNKRRSRGSARRQPSAHTHVTSPASGSNGTRRPTSALPSAGSLPGLESNHSGNNGDWHQRLTTTQELARRRTLEARPYESTAPSRKSPKRVSWGNV